MRIGGFFVDTGCDRGRGRWGEWEIGRGGETPCNSVIPSETPWLINS